VIKCSYKKREEFKHFRRKRKKKIKENLNLKAEMMKYLEKL
jgi:hypothetical protein